MNPGLLHFLLPYLAFKFCFHVHGNQGKTTHTHKPHVKWKGAGKYLSGGTCCDCVYHQAGVWCLVCSEPHACPQSSVAPLPRQHTGLLLILYSVPVRVNGHSWLKWAVLHSQCLCKPLLWCIFTTAVLLGKGKSSWSSPVESRKGNRHPS